MDWQFLLILTVSLLVTGGAMAAGYWVGKHNAYVEMMNDEIKQRLDGYRERLDDLKERNKNVGSDPDHRIG